MQPSQQQLKELINLYSSGNIDLAKKNALNLSKKFPEHPLSWKVLSAIFAQLNMKKDALNYAKKVVEIAPLDAEAHNNLANLLKDLGLFIEAKKSYEKAIEIEPNYAEAFNNLAIFYQENKELEKAEINYKKAISIKNDYFQAYNNLGVTLKDLNKFEESIKILKKALLFKNDYYQAFNNLGVSLQCNGNYEEAISNFKKALSLKKNYPECLNNMGNTYNDLGKFQDAKTYLKKAIQLRPNYAQAFNNLGTSNKFLGLFDDAEKCYRKAITLKEDYCAAYNNLGVVLKDSNKLNDAENNLKKAIQINSDYAEAYYNLSFVKLHKFEFEKGFELYEWRWKTQKRIGNKFLTNKPHWSGEKNKTILVWKEQGIGDEIMFSSNLNDLLLCSKKVILLCDQRLIPLFKRSFPDKIDYKSKKDSISDDDFDYHIAIGSLPFYFRKKLISFENASLGFLKGDSKKINHYRGLLRKTPKTKIIGISWLTKSSQNLAPFRNIPLNELAKILTSFNYSIVNLQYGNVDKEIEKTYNDLNLRIFNLTQVDNLNNIDDLSSLISACDIVITIDNATAHLSGGLGIDTRILLPYSPDARWGPMGSSSYWYKSIKLYRQKKLADWSFPLNELLEDLTND